MSAQRLASLLVVAWLALLPSLGWGQERERLSLEAGTPVTVYADRVQNLEQEKLLLAAQETAAALATRVATLGQRRVTLEKIGRASCRERV